MKKFKNKFASSSVDSYSFSLADKGKQGTGAHWRSGQVAVILIVAIAIGLVLFAASINLAMVSQIKTYTMKAASNSATQMASTIASYGQKQYVETMGSRKEYCKKSHGGLIALVVLIIMIIIAIYTGYYCTECVTGSFTVTAASTTAVMGAVMQGASILISATTDPGISARWNKIQEDNLSQTGTYVERGVMAGLQGAVTDQVKIPDLYDEDGDGIYGYMENDPTKEARDEISRMAHYINKRNLDIVSPDTSKVGAFIEALHDLVVDSSDGFAIMDPVFYPDNRTLGPNVVNSAWNLPLSHVCAQDYYLPGTTDLNPRYNQRPSECDPCCATDAPEDGSCDASSGDEQMGSRVLCPVRTPFRANVGQLYQYVYDPSYEDSTNNFMSLREQLGRDDEHKDYHTTETAANWHSDPVNEPQTLIAAGSPTDFFLRDVVGYYTAPAYPSNTDRWASSAALPIGKRPALYPFLYKMRDWGPQLSALTYANYECQWCDASKGEEPGKTCPDDISPEIGRLTLSMNPLLTPYNSAQGVCVNKFNKGGVDDPPIVPDNVRGISTLIVADNACAFPSQVPASDIAKYVGGWKAGADRYCSNSPDTSYDLNCAKQGGVDEVTGCVGNPANWRDDNLDDIIYGDMPMLLAIEQSLWLGKTSDAVKALAQDIAQWYPGPDATRNDFLIADWIEPPCLSPDNCPGSFTKLPRPGKLYVWREQFRMMRQAILEWITPPGDGAKPKYVSNTCFGSDAVWCLPTAPCQPQMLSPRPGQEEQDTFDADGNGAYGDLPDVIACLNWNATNVLNYSDGTSAAGNAAKFQKCAVDCKSANCSNLPRSLVPDFYTHLPLEFYPGDQEAFEACLDSEKIENCNAKCNNATLPSGSPYVIPAFRAPNFDQIDDITEWCKPGGAGKDGDPLHGGCSFGDLICDGHPGGNETDCRCSWANDCKLANECLKSTCLVAGSYCDALTKAIPVSKGSCGNDESADFKITLEQSATEAIVQIDKFEQRYKFLKGRYEEAQSIVTTLTTAIDKITAFLDGGTPDQLDDSPVEKFIQYRLQAAKAKNSDLPSFAIYVWQDKDPIKRNLAGGPRSGTGEGYWHAVKAEVRMPRRCSGNCLGNDWPKVDSSTSGGFLSKKVCYRLINLEGITKARVIRYDQDKDLTGLIFPSGGQIWKSRMSNPNAVNEADPTGLRVTCAKLIDPDLKHWLEDQADDGHHLGAAFMLNKIPDIENPDDEYTQCWVRVHTQLLAQGVMSESCAQYYFVDKVGFRVKFVPCDKW